MDFVKSSHHRLREMIELGLAALLLTSPVGAVAQPAEGAAGAAQSSTATAALEHFLAHVETLRADFHQELWSADHKLLDKSSGTFALHRPNEFLWDYQTPYQQKIVADGKRLWMYDVGLAQVTVTPLDQTTAGTPAMLLSGDQAVRKSFDVEKTYESGGYSWVELRPKLPGTDFSSIRIGFADGLPRRLDLVDGLDQTTRIEFSNIVANKKLDRGLFRFKVPHGVDVIGDRG